MVGPLESRLYKRGIIEYRWHGRGGQGAWTASELLGRAAIYEGKCIQSFPEFGPERMGAPIKAFTRISSEPIKLHCAVYNPDVAIVIDPTLINRNLIDLGYDTLEGLEKGGTLIVNTKETPDKLSKRIETIYYDKVDSSIFKIYTIPATDIAIKILGMPIANTAMLGATVRAMPVVNIRSIGRVIEERFRSDVAEKNKALIHEAYEAVQSKINEV